MRESSTDISELGSEKNSLPLTDTDQRGSSASRIRSSSTCTYELYLGAMTLLLNLILFLWMQAPVAPSRVIVGLVDGQQLLIEDPHFSGFIETRGTEAGLKYRQDKFHGDLDLASVARIDFDDYQRGKSFHLRVTLRNGQKIQVQSEGPRFLLVKGRTDAGIVTIKHPDPVSSVVKLTTKAANRKRDLTITYLDFQ